ncbi:MAG: carbohydrate ABC transporter permease [Oscillospiraceae bacterium]
MQTQSVQAKSGTGKLGRFVVKLFTYLVLVAACLVVILPILYVLLGSFKTTEELFKTSTFSLPQHFNFDNYSQAISKGDMLAGFRNTAILIVICCFGTIITGTMTAFVVQRFNTLLSRTIKGAFLVAVLLPNISMQVTVYQILADMHLVNSMWGPMILWIGTDITSIYIFIQFLSQIPVSLDESGIVDGASYPRIYWSIILPNLKPAIATVLIIKFVSIYNDFYTPKLYLPEDQPVVSTVLLNIMNETTVSYTTVFAGVILCILPTLIIFLTLQKFIYSGLVSGAVKG